MKIERTKNATRSIIFGTIQNIYCLAIGFLVRTLMIYFMGMQYVGLSSLFTSILQVLNLAELGVGSAMVYNMYKAIAEDDTEKICALMRLYRTYYRIIGVIIAVVGCILLPFIPYLISEESFSSLPSEINVYILYTLNLSATVLTYWLFAYKNCLLNAFQRNDIVSKISLVVTTIKYGLQILSICLFKNYYIYLIVTLVAQIISNITIAFITNKMYPNYKPIGKLPQEEVKGINRRIRDLFTSKIGNVLVNSSDTIVISAFLGLTMLAIYQNYFYVITVIIGIVGIINTSCTAGIANSIIVETKEKNYTDFRKYTFILTWIFGFCTVCLLCLFQPFMEIWVGEELMMSFTGIIFLCIYYFIYEVVQLLNMYKDAAGMWHEDRFRPLVVSLSNLIINLILVQFWDIYGILFSTWITFLIISIPWLLHNLFTVIFEKKYLKGYVLNLLFYSIMTILVCVITYLICYFIPLQNLWAIFFVRLAMCLVVPNLIYSIAYFRKKEFKEALGIINRIMKGKIKFLNKYSNV